MSTEASSTPVRGSLASFLVPWVAAFGLDSVIAWSSYVRPGLFQFVLELGVLGGMGWAQWTFGRSWGRSRLLPAVFLSFFAVLPHSPEGAVQVAPFLVGVLVPLLALARWNHAHGGIGMVGGTLAALVVVAGAHAMDIRAQESGATKVQAPHAMNKKMDAPPATGEGSGRPDASVTSLIVISVDTLRSDAASTMSSVRRLAARGAYWPRAMSTSSWTLPALASLQTGRLPAEHGAACLEDGHCQGISGAVPTLAEQLRDRGWRTAAIVANPWAGAAMGFDRGFDHFVDAGEPGRRLLVGGASRGAHGQDDARTVDAAMKWLDGKGEQPFYLWVHLMGPHMPYLHSPLEKMRKLDPVALRSSYPSSEAQKQEIRDAYANEVAYTDLQVMRLLDVLEARGMLDRGVVVLTADHGEEFWDHGDVEHGHSHHGEVVDVPLVLLAPGLAPGTRSDMASLVDVVPTLRAVSGLEGEGIDLRTPIPPGRIATAWGGLILRLDCSARHSAARLLVQDCESAMTSMRLYDLLQDPAELSPTRPDPGDPLLLSASGIRPPTRSDASSVPSDRLRALGYLQ